MIVAYVTAHGLGHLMRTLEVLRAIRETQPTVPITVVGTVPAAVIHRALRPPVHLRVVACDVGVVQPKALVIPCAACRSSGQGRRRGACGSLCPAGVELRRHIVVRPRIMDYTRPGSVSC